MTTPNLPPEPLGTVPNNPEDVEEALKYYEGQIADQPIENGTEYDYRHSQVIERATNLGIGYKRWQRDF